MRAYKCDCCGSLYEAYQIIELDKRPKNHITFSANSLSLQNSDMLSFKTYDLCPNCMRKILAMLMENRE